jgi:hypothetical protein
VPIADHTQVAEHLVGHLCAVLVLDVVEQPGDMARWMVDQHPLAERRQQVLIEAALDLAQGAEPRRLVSISLMLVEH